MATVDISDVWPEWHAEELLGTGSFGKVYRAKRSELGHESLAAIKVIRIPRDKGEVAEIAAFGMDAMSIRSYFEKRAQGVLDEIAVMEDLKGAPNVVAIEDYHLVEHENDVGWTIFLRMELLEPLNDYYAHKGVPDSKEVARLGVDICQALIHCHGKNIVHRDVKPENIFRGKFAYKLGDFGIARRLMAGANMASTTAGSRSYMAPEVYRNESYDKTVDIYSLGILLYRYLNYGRLPFLPAFRPFDPNDVEEALKKRMRGDTLPPPSQADKELAAIVLRACAFNPRDRWHNVSEMKAALERWLNRGEETLSRKTTLRFHPSTDGSIPPQVITCEAGKPIVLPRVDCYTKDGFKPLGWCRDEGCNGKCISPGTEYIVNEEDGAFYLKWVEIPGQIKQPPPEALKYCGMCGKPNYSTGEVCNQCREAEQKKKKEKLVAIILAIAAAVLALAAIIVVNAPKEHATVSYRINYCDNATNAELLTSINGEAESGESLTCKAPPIKGYELLNDCMINGQSTNLNSSKELTVSLFEVRSGTFEVTFLYASTEESKAETSNYTVRYIDADGKELAKSKVVKDAPVKKKATETAIGINGYELVSPERKSIVVSATEDQIIEFVYAKEEANEQVFSSSSYMLPDSDAKVYSKDELASLSNEELFIARNELYARHGYVFESKYLTTYFSKKSWYKQATSNEIKLNAIESANAKTIMSIETERGSKYLESEYIEQIDALSELE